MGRLERGIFRNIDEKRKREPEGNDSEGRSEGKLILMRGRSEFL
jgi:hypothetical protein